MTTGEWASEYERQKRAADRRLAKWRKQLVPGTVPARSADELLERMGMEVCGHD